jgi:hypothetical protein
LAPAGDGGGGLCGCEEVPGQLVAANGDATEIIGAIEHCLDRPTALATTFVILDRPLSVAARGNHRDGFISFQRGAQLVAAMGFSASGPERGPCHHGGACDWLPMTVKTDTLCTGTV